MINKITSSLKKLPVIITGLSLLSTLGFASVANAVGTPPTSPPVTQSEDYQTIITKGNTEIARRIDTLNKLSSNITASEKISAADKTTLTTEVTNELSGLNTDKTTLDAATTKAAAVAAAQSIFTEYRVYALIVPQVFMIRAADRQQLTEAKLTALATSIGNALGSATSSNASQTTDLTTMKADIASASQLSTTVESAVIALNPSDYNADHTVLVQYYGNLKTAQTDIGDAATQAKTIISSLKTK